MNQKDCSMELVREPLFSDGQSKPKLYTISNKMIQDKFGRESFNGKWHSKQYSIPRYPIQWNPPFVL
jgi:hypothetical protein